jgi:hypothetical protein
VRFWANTILAAVALWPAGNAGGEAVVIVTEADCRLLERHVPGADVAYRGGVDLRGKPVVPADASPYGRPATPQQVAIDVAVPLRAFLFQPPARLGEAEVQVGRIAVDLATGQLAFDGQPLSDPERAQVAAACRDSKLR